MSAACTGYVRVPVERASPRFTDAELEAVLRELEEENHIMYRDGSIHRI